VPNEHAENTGTESIDIRKYGPANIGVIGRVLSPPGQSPDGKTMFISTFFAAALDDALAEFRPPRIHRRS
jgi:hypothetical protein